MTQLKKIVFFTLLLSTMIIKPATPGENIWQVNAFTCEVAEETTSKICEIESKLDTIDLDFGNSINSIADIICSKLEMLETCIAITQEDIDAGFTISTAGKYCLVENVAHTSASAAITITASNVTLDLNGFFIDGTSTATQGVLVQNTNDVIVKNGTILSCTTNGVLIDNADRICFDGVKCSENTSTGFTVLNEASHVLFTNCVAFNNGVVGFLNLDGNYIVYKDCLATGGVIGYSIDLVTSATLVQSNVFINCNSLECSSSGFLASADGGKSIIDTILCHCIAIDCGTGFDFDDAEVDDTIIIECKSISNSSTGYSGNAGTFAFANFAKNNTTNYSGITTPISMIDSADTDIGYWTNNDQ